MSRSGLTLLEVLIMAVLTMLIGGPILASLSVSTGEAAASQDYALAEVLAERYLQEALGASWDTLEKRLPISRPLSGIPAGDEELAARFPEYARKLTGLSGMRGRLEAREVERGLVLFEVTLDWPVKPGSAARRTYSLIRMKARSDLSLAARATLSRGIPASIDHTPRTTEGI